jgi:RNA polymerase sigma factor (sigma-70 family)
MARQQAGIVLTSERIRHHNCMDTMVHHGEHVEQFLAHADRAERERAFGLLVADHAGMVQATCSRILGPRHANLDDAVQATFVILARKLTTIRDLRALAGWLHATATTVALQQLRADRRRRAHEGAARALGTLAISNSPNDEWQAVRAQLDCAIEKLRSAQRDAVVRHYLEGKPQAQVAHELGISVDAVKQRCAYAIERLRRLLKRSGIIVPVAALTTGLVSEGAAMATGAELATTLSQVLSNSPTTTSAMMIKGYGMVLAVKKAITATIVATALALPVLVIASTIFTQSDERLNGDAAPFPEDLGSEELTLAFANAAVVFRGTVVDAELSRGYWQGYIPCFKDITYRLDEKFIGLPLADVGTMVTVSVWIARYKGTSFVDGENPQLNPAFFAVGSQHIMCSNEGFAVSTSAEFGYATMADEVATAAVRQATKRKIARAAWGKPVEGCALGIERMQAEFSETGPIFLHVIMQDQRNAGAARTLSVGSMFDGTGFNYDVEKLMTDGSWHLEHYSDRMQHQESDVSFAAGEQRNGYIDLNWLGFIGDIGQRRPGTYRLRINHNAVTSAQGPLSSEWAQFSIIARNWSSISIGELVRMQWLPEGRVRTAAATELFRRGTAIAPKLLEEGAKPGQLVGSTRLDMIYNLIIGIPADFWQGGLHPRNKIYLEFEVEPEPKEIARIEAAYGTTFLGRFVKNANGRHGCFVNLLRGENVELVMQKILCNEENVMTVSLKVER